MGQIVRRRKKGRPSKADLSGLRHSAAAQPSPILRRSTRCRSFRYNIIDYDEDYLDDDEDFQLDEENEDYLDDEDEEHCGSGGENPQERRREKKLKLVVKLPTTTTKVNNSSNTRPTRLTVGESASGTPRNRREAAESESEEDEHDEEEEEEGSRMVKKRRISANECDEDDEEDDYSDEGRRGSGEIKREESLPGTPGSNNDTTPLPEKKRLELILDKLQKKDTYGVYGEPVDPEELPDYHNVIDHPMDFATIRKKLANGSYPTLEQFESDVFLICSNAMQYNAPNTIYHKQARTIKELAERKIQRVRDHIERSEKEKKPEQLPKTEHISKSEFQSKSSSVVMKQMNRNTQEPVASDFVSGATLAAAEIRKKSNSVQVSNGERHNNDGGILEDNSSFLPDNTAAEKTEDQQSGKGLLLKFGWKSSLVDESRRLTYDPSCQQADCAGSNFNTFEGEKKHLISVGLQGEYPYARSLARFAGALGSVAWKLASKRIEQALPLGFKFGRGWIGEYEPPSTTVAFYETRYQKDTLSKKSQSTAESKNEKFPQNSVPATSHFLPAERPSLDVKPSLIHSGGNKPSTPISVVNKQQNPLSWEPRPPEKKNEQQSPLFRVSIPVENKIVKRVESHSRAIANRNGENCRTSIACVVEMPIRPVDTVTRSDSSLQQLPLKQPDSNGSVVPGGLRNGKSIHNSLDINQAISSPRSISSSPVVGVTPFTQRQEQGVRHAVHTMQTVSEQVQKLPDTSNPSVGPLQVRPPSLPSPREDNRNNAAAAAAGVRMSVGARGFKAMPEKYSLNTSQISANSLYSTSRNLQAQMFQSHGEVRVSGAMHFPPGKMSLPFQAFVPQPIKVASDMQAQSRPTVFSQFATTDMSRFPVQPPWRGLSPHAPLKEKQDKLPPDLNIAFQAPVDSQQPDLALQL